MSSPPRVLATPDPAVGRAEEMWKGMGGVVTPTGPAAMAQRNWDEVISREAAGRLREGADERTLARLLAFCAPESGVWLNAIPSASLGLNLDDSALSRSVLGWGRRSGWHTSVPAAHQ